MSIVIQKKKIQTSKSRFAARISSIVDQQNDAQCQYTKLFEEFQDSFEKLYDQKNYKGLKQILENFHKCIQNDDLLMIDLSRDNDLTPKNSPENSLAQKAENIVRSLADYLVHKRDFPIKKKSFYEFLDTTTTIHPHEITIIVVKSLKVLSTRNSKFAKLLSNWSLFLETLLQLILENAKLYFKHAVSVIEALITTNPTSLTPEMYPLVQEILSTMSMKNFARFSRIVALLVLENSEKPSSKDLLSNIAPDNKIIKIHSLLLSVPQLLDNYLVILEHLRNITSSLSSVTPETLEKTIAAFNDSKIIRDSGLNLSFLKPLFEQSQISQSLLTEVFSPKFIIKFVTKKSNITEILFILSSLLSSKRKIDIQEELNQMDFFNRVLHPLFDLLFNAELEFDNIDDNNDLAPPNPLTTTRIQLLRVIINYCDRDSCNIDSKICFISSEEQEFFFGSLMSQALNQSFVDENQRIDFNPRDFRTAIHQMTFTSDIKTNNFFTKQTLTANAFDGIQNKGLLNKIISLLKKVHANSTFHFWLCSCIKSVMRGFNSFHQIFVAHNGLLYHLFNQIIKNEMTKSNNIQISYDLIAEIIQFNKYNIVFLEHLSETFEFTHLIYEKVNQNIIDSNVFLRSMLLSFEQFSVHQKKEADPENKKILKESLQSLRLLNSLNKDCVNWFNLLVEAVTADIFHHDNICCINTALIIIIFAQTNGKMHYLLDSLRNEKSAQNFILVLDVWQKYYSSKTKDGFSLQYTTAISFSYFQDIKQKIQSYYLKSKSETS